MTESHSIVGLRRQRFELHKPRAIGLSCAIRPAGNNSPTLLLLHGTGSDQHSFDPLCQHLPGEWGLIIPDLPGHGQSTLGRSSPPSHVQPDIGFGLHDMVEWLEELLDQLGLAPTLLVGHSAGAAIALLMSLSKSGRRVLGLAPSLVPPPPVYNHLVGPWLSPLVRSRPSLALAHWLAGQSNVIDRLLASTGSDLSNEQRQHYRELFQSRTHLEGTLAFMAATDLPMLLADPRLGSLPDLTFMSAKDDPWIPAGSLAKIFSQRMPQAEVRWLPRGGHLFHETDPATVGACIAELTRA